ncbi:MAG TPA: hypothetical protein VHE14_04350 [Solirubrobacteraceae bacterium]|nr:hypothetical protein [Solirubrobacteraceae bacterium]
MRLKLACTLVAGSLAAVPFAGCGSSSSPKDAAKSYLKALSDGDYGKACGLISKSAKQGIESHAAGKKCPGALSSALKSGAGAQAVAKFKDAPITNVKTNGNKASATAQVKGIGPLPLQLVKEGGKWKVALSSATG